MGNIQVSAVATVFAALIAVLGSITAVAISAWSQRMLLEKQLPAQAKLPEAGRAQEDAAARRAALASTCAQFDAAVVQSIARLQRAVDLADRPAVRRQLMGPRWAQHWERNLHEALSDVSVPYSTLRFASEPDLLAAADEVMLALRLMADRAGAVPAPLPPSPLSLLRRQSRRNWRDAVDDAHANVHTSRAALVSLVDEAAARTAQEQDHHGA